MNTFLLIILLATPCLAGKKDKEDKDSKGPPDGVDENQAPDHAEESKKDKDKDSKENQSKKDNDKDSKGPPDGVGNKSPHHPVFGNSSDPMEEAGNNDSAKQTISIEEMLKMFMQFFQEYLTDNGHAETSSLIKNALDEAVDDFVDDMDNYTLHDGETPESAYFGSSSLGPFDHTGFGSTGGPFDDEFGGSSLGPFDESGFGSTGGPFDDEFEGSSLGPFDDAGIGSTGGPLDDEFEGSSLGPFDEADIEATSDLPDADKDDLKEIANSMGNDALTLLSAFEKYLLNFVTEENLSKFNASELISKAYDEFTSELGL